MTPFWDPFWSPNPYLQALEWPKNGVKNGPFWALLALLSPPEPFWPGLARPGQAWPGSMGAYRAFGPVLALYRPIMAHMGHMAIWAHMGPYGLGLYRPWPGLARTYGHWKGFWAGTGPYGPGLYRPGQGQARPGPYGPYSPGTPP